MMVVWKEGRIIGPQEAKGSRPDWVQRWAAAGGGEQGGAGGGCSWAVDSKAASRFYWLGADSTPVMVQEEGSLLRTSTLVLEAPAPL